MQLLDKPNIPNPIEPDTRGFGEAFSDYVSATYDLMKFRDNSGASDEALSQAYWDRIRSIEQATGVKLKSPYYPDDLSVDPNPAGWFTADKFKERAARFDEEMRSLAVQHPDKADLIRADIPIIYDAARLTQGAVAAADAEDQRSPLGGVAKFGAGLIGGIGAMLRDPPQVAALFVGPEAGAAKTIGTRVLSRMATDATINAGQELILQQAAEKWREQSGTPITVGQMWSQVGLAAAFGGGVGGLFQGAGEILGLLGRRTPAAEKALEEITQGTPTPEAIQTLSEALGVPVAPDETAALSRALEEDAADAAVAASSRADPQATSQAMTAIEQGTATLPAPEAPLNAPGNFRFIPVENIKTDAARFQFKEGGDAQGVTDRLKGVTEWKPERAGTLIVYEDTNGALFVADGHQRTGLARRISENSGQSIAMPSYVFRAADGFTAEDVRVLAALKNIGEGSGTAIDAAKVLRTGRMDAKATGLPPNSAMVRDAAGLARLSDDAFTMAINEVVDARYAAIVGRLVDDPKLHAQMLDTLKAAEPASMAEASSMVRDMLSEPTFTEKQNSLFGDEEVKRMLLREKAQVRAATLRALRKDRAVFNRLIEEQSRIAEAGNILDTAANSARAQTDAIIIEAIDKLSRTVGPVADALNDAARAVAGGQSPAAAAKGFTEHVRGAVEQAGGNLGRVDGPPVLVDPNQAGKAAIEPGTPESAEAASQALEAATDAQERARLEAEGQSSMFGPSGPLDPPAAASAPPKGLESIVNPVDPSLTPEAKVARLVELTNQSEIVVEQIIADVKKALGDIDVRANRKDPANILTKASRPSILAKKPWHQVEHLRDSYRFKAVLGDVRDMPAVVDILKRHGVGFVKVDMAKVLKPEMWGFRIASFDLRMPNGQIVEFYLPVKEMEEAKKPGHKLFEKWRNLDLAKLSADQHAEFAQDMAKSNALYQSAWDAYLAREGISESDVRASLDKVTASAGVTEENSLLNSSPVKLKSDVQAPSRQSALTPGPSTTTRPSSDLPTMSAIRGDIGQTAAKSNSAAPPAEMQISAEQTAAGTQILIPGVAQITVKDQLQAQATKAMKGGNAAPPAGGLFDDAARDQIDLLDAIPAGNDAEGRPVMTTHAELAAQADRVDYLADVVLACKE